MCRLKISGLSISQMAQCFDSLEVRLVYTFFSAWITATQNISSNLNKLISSFIFVAHAKEDTFCSFVSYINQSVHVSTVSHKSSSVFKILIDILGWPDDELLMLFISQHVNGPTDNYKLQSNHT